jgi:hypothetical protein
LPIRLSHHSSSLIQRAILKIIRRILVSRPHTATHLPSILFLLQNEIPPLPLSLSHLSSSSSCQSPSSSRGHHTSSPTHHQDKQVLQLSLSRCRSVSENLSITCSAHSLFSSEDKDHFERPPSCSSLLFPDDESSEDTSSDEQE